MISKARIKQIRALDLKKNRDELGVFVAEGPKVVKEMLNTCTCTYLAATQNWADENKDVNISDIVTQEELIRASFLKTPQEVLGIFRQKTPPKDFDASATIQKELCLALDCIQNPGNLGTIIRLADWFGIRHIFCSTDTADAYAPKTVQATMGALARVQLHYLSLEGLLSALPNGSFTYGTFLNGENIYKQPLQQCGLIVMGNEGRGIRQTLEPYINQRLYIPNYATGPTSESLNVAIATAIVCAEFRRRH